MAVKVRFTGADKVLRNLNTEIKKIEGRTQDGLVEAALLIKNRAGRITPRDTGNLVNSAYVMWPMGKHAPPANFKGEDATKLSGDHDRQITQARNRMNKQKQPSAEIGYTAYYAVYVHEVDKNYRGNKTWKFLETALYENAGKIISIIKKRARIS